MSKTITIPADVSRMEIIINEKTWTFAGGATVTVPDEVADLIANNAANKPSGKRPVENPIGNDGLYTGTDYIEVYTTEDGTLRIKKTDVQDVMDPFVVTLTPTSEDLSGTMDKTPAEIWAAFKAGKRFKFSIPSMNAEVYPSQFQLYDTDEDGVPDSVVVHASIMYTMSEQLYLIGVGTSNSTSTYGTALVPLTEAT